MPRDGLHFRRRAVHTGPMVVQSESLAEPIPHPFPALSLSCLCVTASPVGCSRSWGRGSFSSGPPKNSDLMRVLSLSTCSGVAPSWRRRNSVFAKVTSPSPEKTMSAPALRSSATSQIPGAGERQQLRIEFPSEANHLVRAVHARTAQEPRWRDRRQCQPTIASRGPRRRECRAGLRPCFEQGLRGEPPAARRAVP